MLPLPFSENIPKLLSKEMSQEGTAFVNKVDNLLKGIYQDVLELYFLKSPARIPTALLMELDFILNSSAREKHTEREKREKIAGSVAWHKVRGTWTQDVKIRIDNITGLSARIYHLDEQYDDDWILCGEDDSVIFPPGNYWSTLGGEDAGLIDKLGLALIGDGNEIVIAGNIYIDCHEAVNVSTLTTQQIEAIVEDLDKDIVPAYFQIFLGYIDAAGEFIVYSGGIIK